MIDFEQNDQSFYEFVLKLFLEHDQKISLVGWSIGGARAVKFAYEHPELVKQVITLGTPYRTSPVLDALSKYVYRDIHEAVTNLSCAIPLTAIYGQIDSLVRGKNGALLNENLDQLCWRENVPVFTNHYGIGYSISALRVIAEKLSSDVPSTHKD